VVLGASFDPVSENDAFANKFSFPFKLLSDTKRELGMKYGAAETPTDGYAKRIAYLIGPDGKIRHVWPKVDVKAFTEEVLAAL
jgi:thioredoxin-dependent peroxiredoxin